MGPGIDEEEEDAASPMRFSDGSPAAGLPVYAAAAADRMARRPRTPSIESDVSMTESERRREATAAEVQMQDKRVATREIERARKAHSAAEAALEDAGRKH